MTPDTALSQIERLLHLVPLAGRKGGIPYDELADALGIDRRQLDRDLETLTARDFYLPGGAVNDLQVILDEDRVRVWTSGHLKRPTRLGPGEAAALDLGLRMLAAERDQPAPDPALTELLERVARSLPGDAVERVVADPGPDAAGALLALVLDASRRGRMVRLQYLKADAANPEPRRVSPYAVAHAAGHSYVIGEDEDAGDIRVFRADRILEAALDPGTFTVPDGFDPADWLDHGRVYRADDELQVTVRYSPRVARWILEGGEAEPQEDGGVCVTHHVADRGWIVRHVLQYGPDAEVVAPGFVRAWVGEAAARVAGRHGPA